MRSADAADVLTTSAWLSGKSLARTISFSRARLARAEVSPRSISSSTIIFMRVSEATRLSSASSSKGLDRKSSAPISRPLTRSARLSSAVTITTGMCAVAGASFSRRQTSKPSIPGNMTSSSTRSGLSVAASRIASSPVAASMTW